MKRNINRCKIRNLSLALLIFISQGARAMERAETTEASQQAPKNNYETILREIEELTKRIHAEVDQVLADYKRDTEEYHRRMGARRDMTIPTTGGRETPEAPEGAKAETQQELEKKAEELGLIFPEIYSKYGNDEKKEWLSKQISIQEKVNQATKLGVYLPRLNQVRQHSTDSEMSDWLDRQITIQERINTAVENAEKLGIDKQKYENLRGELKSSQNVLGGMNENQINQLLDREIPIQRLLLEEEQDKIKKAINLNVDFDPLFKSQNIKNAEDINKWLDTQISIKEKEEIAGRLGTHFTSRYGEWVDDDKIEWLDRQIAIQGKINIAVENAEKLDIDKQKYEKLRGELKSNQMSLGGMNKNQINQLLDREIPIQRLLLKEEQDKIKKAINLKVDFDPLFESQNIKNPDDVNKWLDTQISIQEKVNQATKLGVYLPRLNQVRQRSTDSEMSDWLDRQIAIQGRINTAVENAEKLGIDKKRYQKLRDELRGNQSGLVGMNEKEINQLLDREIPIQEKILQADPEKVKKAKELKVNFDPLFESQNIKNPEDIKKWLDKQIALNTKEKEAKELNIFIPWNYYGSNDDAKIEWLDRQITIKTKEKEAKDLKVDLYIYNSNYNASDDAKIEWLDSEIAKKQEEIKEQSK